MLTTQNTTSKTLQGFCHMKYTTCAMKKREPNHQHQGIQLKDKTTNNQTKISNESNSTL